LFLTLEKIEKICVKKILLVNDHYHFGGGGDAVFNFEINVLVKHGYEVFTFSFNKEYPENQSVNYSYLENISSTKRKLQKFLGDKNIDKAFINALNSIKPDLIHIHLISKYPLAIYKNIHGYKVIQTLHGPNLFCASSWGGLKDGSPCELGIGMKCYTRGCVTLSASLLYQQLESRYWDEMKESVDLFHCPSRQLYGHVKRLELLNSEYIPLGIDIGFEEQVSKPNNDRPILLFVGALAEQKGIKVLIEAMKQLVLRVPNVLLKVAGRGELVDWIKARVNEYDIGANIELLGFVDHEKVRDLYIEADIFVMPSIWHEQFGLVGPEALACETPCVGSNIGGIPEWLHHNEWGLLVPPNQVDDLTEAIITLIQNPKLRKNMGKKGREFVLMEYGAKKYESNILNMIESVIKTIE
jgi:glycosyltransferase involved in cell wall biosynthesis